MRHKLSYIFILFGIIFLLTTCTGDKRNTKAEKEATKVIEGDTVNLRKEKEGSLGHRFMEPDSL